MDKHLIILVAGYKRSGKDFISNYILKSFSDSKLFSFASPLKEIVADTFNISLSDLDNFKNNRDPIRLHPSNSATVKCLGDFRTILQRLGTEAMKKQFGNDIWGELFIKKISELPPSVIVVPDFRFEREWEMLSELFDVVTIRIEDKNIKPEAHISETALDEFDFDFRIDNTAKNNHFKIPTSHFLEELRSKYTLD